MALKIGTSGNDILTGTTLDDDLRGLGGADILIGTGGNDDLEGGADNDTLSGGEGNDYLDGGTGVDVMEGGTGDDTYYIDNVLDKISEGVGAGLDKVHVGLSSYTVAANVEYVFMDLNTNSSVAGNVLNNAIYMRGGNDTVYGAGGNDFILAGAGNDVIYGGDGNDDLYGEAGNNTLYGGADDDTYNLTDWTNAATQIVSEARGGGYDRVVTAGIGLPGATGAAGELHTYTLASNVEELVATGNFSFWLTGNANDNTIFGGTYADTLMGGAGADKMYGGTGADVYVIDNAGDRALFETLNYSAMDTARITAAITWKLDSGVERVELIASGADVTGSAFDDLFYGSVGGDSMRGGGGHDRIYGGGGADYLEGGSGNDILHSGASLGSTLSGGDGDDSYVLGASGDTIIESAGGGLDSVDLYWDWVMSADVEVARVQTALGLSVTGNDSANQIYGGAGTDLLMGGLGNDTLNGSAGSDTMKGGEGDDLYFVYSGGDVVEELANQGIDTVYSDINLTLGANVEHLNLTGAAKIGTGNALHNRLTAFAGDNNLNGNAGADTLDGGSGADMLFGGAGGDVFLFHTFDNSAAAGMRDTIGDFQRGKDKIDLSFVDSDTSNEVHDAAIFLGTAAFTGQEGEMRYATTAGGVELLIDLDGDGAADMGFDLMSLTDLKLTDFLL